MLKPYAHGRIWAYDATEHRVLKAFRRNTLEELWEDEKRHTPQETSYGSHLSEDEIGNIAAIRIDGFAQREFRHLRETPQWELSVEEAQLSGMHPGNLDEITNYLLEVSGLDTSYEYDTAFHNFLRGKIDEFSNQPKRKIEGQTAYMVTSERLSPLDEHTPLFMQIYSKIGVLPQFYSRGILATSPLGFDALADVLWEADVTPNELLHIVAIFHRKVTGHADYHFLGLGRIGVIEETGSCDGLMERIIQQNLYEKDAAGKARVDFFDKIL